MSRRWLSRFSLRTLLLLVLLIGSAATLWWRGRDPWEVQHLLKTKIDGSSPIQVAYFSRDGRIVVTNGGVGRNAWDVNSGGTTQFKREYETLFQQLSPNRELLAEQHFNSVQIIELRTGKLISSLNDTHDTDCVPVFSPDSSRIITASNTEGIANVWDISFGKKIYTLQGHTMQLMACAFSPDGRFIVTASADDTARIWRTEDGFSIHVLKGHSEYVYSACFSPDGKQVLTASMDGTARIWSADTGTCLSTLKGHESWVLWAAYSPNGERIVTVTNADFEFGIVRIWRKRRPEYWWGVAWLPEFWLTVVFAGAFAWSLGRDRAWTTRGVMATKVFG